MNGRAAGAGMPILFGSFLLYKYLPKSALFVTEKDAKHESMVAALGALLLIIGLVFLIRNSK